MRPFLRSSLQYRHLPFAWPAHSKSFTTHPALQSSQADLDAQVISNGFKPDMPPKDGKPKQKKPIAIPRPSASVVLISPQNHILLLQRVKQSSTFASAHVFPGGNVSELHDYIGVNKMPPPESADRHQDSETYRMAAVRETFEESGIILAKGENGRLLEVEESEREKGRQDVHGSKVKFGDWLDGKGGKADTAGLIPFTRWVTPITMPKRFTTQMYLYFLPTSSSTPLSGSSSGNTNDLEEEPEIKIPNPTPDGGKEHTTARFLPASAWLRLAQEGRVILFPPQFFLLHQVAQHFDQLKFPIDYASISRSPLSRDELERRRESLRKFVQTGDPPWTEMCMSPTPQARVKREDGRAVLALDRPGPEVERSGGGRKGIWEQCVLVDFTKEGPRRVAVVRREDVLPGGEVKL